MEDHLDEESQIMNERDEQEKLTLSVEAFREQILKLRMPPVQTLDISGTIKNAVDIMQENNIGSIVVTKERKLEGIVTERDILMKVIGKIDKWEETNITTVMTADPTSLRPQDMIAYVMNNMSIGGYRHVPIVNDENEPISIVSIKDIMNYIVSYFPGEIVHLTSEPYRGPVNREGG